jgi:hypothetical protein
VRVDSATIERSRRRGGPARTRLYVMAILSPISKPIGVSEDQLNADVEMVVLARRRQISR